MSLVVEGTTCLTSNEGLSNILEDMSSWIYLMWSMTRPSMLLVWRNCLSISSTTRSFLVRYCRTSANTMLITTRCADLLHEVHSTRLERCIMCEVATKRGSRYEER